MDNFTTGTNNLKRTHLKSQLFQYLKALSLEEALLPTIVNEPINELIEQLELLNPIPEPLHPQSFPLLLGSWQLTYASQGTVVTRKLASTPNFLLKSIIIKQIWQNLSAGETGKLRVENGATIELPILGTWQITAEGTWKWNQENQPSANVIFDTFSIQSIPHQSLKMPILKIPVFDFIKNEALWITSYLDSEIRIGKGKTGNLFIFYRSPSSIATS